MVQHCADGPQKPFFHQRAQDRARSEADYCYLLSHFTSLSLAHLLLIADVLLSQPTL